jgi:deoxyribodipyrimidine photo-lyase
MQIVWFRRDLRTIDNTALNQAVATGEPVLALFLATPHQWKSHNKAPIQAHFLYRRLYELQRELNELNIPLLYQEVSMFADQVSMIRSLLRLETVNGVHANREYELNEQQRDGQIEALEIEGKDVHFYHDKCVMRPRSVLNKQGDYFKVFTPFKRAWLAKVSMAGVTVSPRLKRANDDFPCVGLLLNIVEEFNHKCHFTYPTEDSAAYAVDTESIIQKLRDFCRESASQYKDDRDLPAIEGTSRLSPYLVLGCLSPRQCIARLTYQENDRLKNFDELNEGEQTWLSELIWREFYQHLLEFEPKLSKGLPFVDWSIDLEWHNDEDWLTRWKNGETGYPIVDAAMRQLNQTGWMHNRLRMIVASFLTKDLLIDWRKGEDYFMSKLIDGDYAANNGGWQWSASTGCDGQPYFRIFNPVSQGGKFDAQGEFICKWIPELKEVPQKFIHQPWNWTKRHTLDYPKPMVDHKTQREMALDMYKKAKG